MRPGQQNKRSRGRNNGRKSFNPLSRNFESNGPDVKIRGNAAHIAEKYLQLARDAQATGDNVMAENYFQHAEHYFRLISAAQAQMPVQQRQEQPGFENDQDSDDDQGEDEADTEAEAERPQPERSQPERSPRREAAPKEVKEPEASRPEGESEQAASEEPRKVRRPRRKRTPSQEPQAGQSDPGSAPQPELPAFLTGGSTPSAAE